MAGGLRDLTSCPVCYDPMRDARNMPCGHSFCLACLQAIQRSSRHRQWRCPTCRSPTSVQPSALPKNFVACEMADRVHEVYATFEKQRREIEQSRHDLTLPNPSCKPSQPARSTLRFHELHGTCVQLSAGGTVATRVGEGRKDGLVLSCRPLMHGENFEVEVSQLHRCWIDSLEIGVVECDPGTLTSLPCELHEWRSSNAIWFTQRGLFWRMNGEVEAQQYSNADLFGLAEGDRVGLLLSHEGVLNFFINGVDQGAAASGITDRWFVAVNMLARVAQVSIKSPASVKPATSVQMPALPPRLSLLQSWRHSSTSSDDSDDSDEPTHTTLDELDLVEFAARAAEQSQSSEPVRGPQSRWLRRLIHPLNGRPPAAQTLQDIQLHRRAFGQNLLLKDDRRVAERLPHTYDKAVVMSSRPLEPNELLEVTIEAVDVGWCGCLALGVTELDPESQVTLPQSVRDRDSEMRHFGPKKEQPFNVGDRIGLCVTELGELHFFYNGFDAGASVSGLQHPLWAVIDVYGKTTRVRLQEPRMANLLPRVSNRSQSQPELAAARSLGTSGSRHQCVCM